jgi:hypothetical protein
MRRRSSQNKRALRLNSTWLHTSARRLDNPRRTRQYPRLHYEFAPARREQVERTTLRIVGACFIALALYIAYESSSTLIRQEVPERSIPGIVIAASSVIVMPRLQHNYLEV